MPGLLPLMLAKRSAPALGAREAIVAREPAMLLLGFGAALRRAELVALTLGDVERVPDKGLLLTIARSKTDQHGQGQRVAVCANPTVPAFCPAAALDACLAHRRTAPDLDWTAIAAARAGRPLFCAVTQRRCFGSGPNRLLRRRAMAMRWIDVSDWTALRQRDCMQL